MNTLKQQAEKMNLYTLEDIPSAWREDNENFQHRIKCGAQDVPEFLQTAQGYECGLFYECNTQDQGTEKEIKYINHAYILVKKTSSELVLLLAKDWRTKKHRLFPYYSILHKYNNLSYHLKETANKLQEPNFIGLFTLNKLNAWHEHCTAYVQALEQAYNQANEKNAEIEKQIQSFIDSVSGADVKKWNNNTTVETEFFRIRFEHSKKDSYLSTYIDYKGTLENVAKIVNLMK